MPSDFPEGGISFDDVVLEGDSGCISYLMLLPLTEPEIFVNAKHMYSCISFRHTGVYSIFYSFPTFVNS
jgi:hypothetical protein